MLLDWIVVAAGLGGGVFILLRADDLAARPRRGTELRLSAWGWRAAALAPLAIAVGALLDIVGG